MAGYWYPPTSPSHVTAAQGAATTEHNFLVWGTIAALLLVFGFFGPVLLVRMAARAGPKFPALLPLARRGLRFAAISPWLALRAFIRWWRAVLAEHDNRP